MAMVLLFGLAALFETIGAASIISAFLAGMAVWKSVLYRVHEPSNGVTALLVRFFSRRSDCISILRSSRIHKW